MRHLKTLTILALLASLTTGAFYLGAYYQRIETDRRLLIAQSQLGDDIGCDWDKEYMTDSEVQSSCGIIITAWPSIDSLDNIE